MMALELAFIFSLLGIVVGAVFTDYYWRQKIQSRADTSNKLRCGRETYRIIPGNWEPRFGGNGWPWAYTKPYSDDEFKPLDK